MPGGTGEKWLIVSLSCVLNDFTSRALPVTWTLRPVSSQSCPPMSDCSQQHCSAFVDLAEDAETEVDVGDEVGVEAGQPLLRLIDPDFAGNAAEDVGLEIRGNKVRIGREAEAVALAGGAGNRCLPTGRGAHRATGRADVVDALCVLLLALAAMLLQLGMRRRDRRGGSSSAWSTSGLSGLPLMAIRRATSPSLVSMMSLVVS